MAYLYVNLSMHKIFENMNCKVAVTTIAIGTKLSKKYQGTRVDSTMYKRLVGSLIYISETRPNIMYVPPISL